MSARRQIGNTLTVNIIDDPISIIAQYAPNDNPTASQIHITWQTGDLYMRTKSTDANATWSAWHKIVGENGDETDYTFNISREKTSASATTEPSNCYYNAWQDAPITATAQYPYLWMKVVKKEWSESTQTYVSGTPSYVRVTGEESIDYSIDGALNSIKLRAGDTSTAVSCVYTFYQKPAVSATRSTVSCYYAVYLRSGSTFSLLTMNSGYTNHGSGTSVDVRANVPYNSGNTIYDAVVIYTFASEYYNTNPESQSYMAKKEIPIIKDGENSFLVDLDNEMSSTVVDEGGNTKSAVAFHPLVRAFYGTQNVISDCTVTVTSSDADVSATYNTTTHCVDVSIATDTWLSETTTITVTVNHSSYGTRGTQFIISAVRDGVNASIQELLPNLNEISFSRQADKTLTPAHRDLQLSIKKTKGETTTIQTVAQSGLTVRWSSASMPATSSEGNAWGSGTGEGISWRDSGETMRITSGVTANNICIACFNSGGTLVDRETVPIIKDGQHGNNGDDAPNAFASPEKISVPCNSNGSVKTAQTTNVTFSMKVGTHDATVSSVSCTAYPTGVTIGSVSTAVKSITIPTTQTASGISTGCTFSVTGTYDGKTYTAQVTVALIGATQGENAFVVDLDNEMTSIIVDEDGDTTEDIELSPLVRAFYGTQNVIGSCTVTASSDDPDMTVEYNSTTHCVDISISEGTYLNKTTTITISVVHSTYGDRDIDFIIGAVRNGANGAAAVLQELLPSINEISFSRTTNGSLTPPSRDLELLIKKTEGGSTSNQSISASGLTIRWSTSSMPSTSSGGTAWGSGTATGITWSSGTMVVANNVDSSNIYIAAFNSSGTLVDRETIPIIKDGKNGDKGDLISFTNTLTSITIECDSNGLSLAASTKAGLIALYVNGSQLPPITLTMVSKPTSLTVTTSGSGIPTGGFSVSWSSGVNMANLQGTIVLRASSTGYSAEISIPVMCTKNGERGKIGRFYYYAGAWSDYSSTDTFDVTDTQAPFFLYNNNYWVYNPDANGTYTKSSMGTPSSSTAGWKMMESNFTYLITMAIFGDYAHFGSAIINGDWMISQHGTYGGNTPIDYTKFDPAYPSTSVYTNHTVNGTTWLGYNFVPNYAVDLLTGKTYMTSAEVRGTIRADNLYHGITFVSALYDGYATTSVYSNYKWYCMPASVYGSKGYDNLEQQQPYYNNFSIGKYYTQEEITTLSGGALTAPENHGFMQCIGDNDNVYVLPDTNNRLPTVYLPAPADVQGKVVDVFGFNYGTPSSIPTFQVKNVGNPNSGMTPLIYYDASENKWKAAQSGGTAYITVSTNAAMRFISTGVTVGSTTTWWWLAVPFYKKELTSS